MAEELTKEEAERRAAEVAHRLMSKSPPQRVTLRGQDAVVVVSAADDCARLAPAASTPTLAALFAEGPFTRLDRFEDSLARAPARFRAPPDFEA